MTTVSQSTKRKLSLLQLAEELGNVSKACRIMGYHRDTFYEVQKAFKVGGVGALVEERPVQTILTDNGRELSRRPEQHPYQLFLALHDIEHRTTKVRSPRTNGFVERMNRTLLDEHFRIKGRDKWYESAEEIQHDLDAFLDFYNLKRSH